MTETTARERTDAEIVARIEQLRGGSPIMSDPSKLVACLPFDLARPYLADDVTPEMWAPSPRDGESILAAMRDYMPFAWEKANGERELSTIRALNHYQSWIWLRGDSLSGYGRGTDYGRDILRRICDHYGWDADQWDDGLRTNG